MSNKAAINVLIVFWQRGPQNKIHRNRQKICTVNDNTFTSALINHCM